MAKARQDRSVAVTVFQSSSDFPDGWLAECLGTVREWCVAQGFEYQFLDDALFEKSPPPCGISYKATPILADLAVHLLGSTWRKGVSPSGWMLTRCFRSSLDSRPGAGSELWRAVLEKSESGDIRAPAQCFHDVPGRQPRIAFLHHVAHSMIARVDPAAIAPQMVGPKLLKALHNLASFHLHPEAGALSPGMAEELVAGGGPLSQRYRAAARAQTKMWNLCGSLAGQGRHRSNLETLTRQPELFDLLAT